MIGVLVSKQFIAGFGDELKAVAERAGKSIDFMTLPEGNTRLSQADCDRITCTYMCRDIRHNEATHAAFGEAVLAAQNLQWIHLSSAGVGQLPYVPALFAKGITITNASGSNAEPVAQTAMTAMLMLARCFPGFIQGQHHHEWRPLRGPAFPDDLRGQTVVLIGVGAIGKIFTDYAHTFGLKVVGVRRSPRMSDDRVDELHHPTKLPELFPRADWVVLACPLTKETRHLIDADALQHMRRSTRLINVGRGELIDEIPFINAIRSGHLGGAWLDNFKQEPLPADSELWDLPNVIVTPHIASSSTGNEKRAAEQFIADFGHWVRAEPMFNVVKSI